MKHLVQILVDIFLYAFIISSLFGAGLGLTINEIFEPLKKIKLVLGTLIANFVLIPAMAYALSVLLRVDPYTQAGLLILACCAGGPALPKLVNLAKGNTAHSISTMVLLLVTTIFMAPIILQIALPGLSINLWGVAQKLAILMLVPLIFGLIIKAKWQNLAKIFHPIAEGISSTSLIALGCLFLFFNYKLFISAYGSGVYTLTFLFTSSAILIGFIFSGGNKKEKSVVMLGSGLRCIEAALIVVAANFSEPKIITVVLIGGLVQFIILFVLARVHGRFFALRKD